MCELGELVGARRVLEREIGWLDGKEEEAQGGQKKIEIEIEKEKEENIKQAAAPAAEGSLERRLAAIKLRQVQLQFTCFTGTKVQILTQLRRQLDERIKRTRVAVAAALLASSKPVLSLLALLVQKYKY